MVFGDDGEKIEGDGTDLTISSSAVATIDAGTDIVLDADGADIFLKDGGTLFGTLTNSGTQLVIKSSSSGTTALTFSGANATFAGTLATAAGGFNVAGLDIDGATDIGADIVDADLFIIDDGAGGTNRKTTAARVKTYIGGGTSWQAVKTGAFTAVAGEGYFVNTTSSAFTATLPAGTIGDEISFIDYAGTFDSYNLTVDQDGSEKIHGSTDALTVATERAAFTLVFTDSTQGWLLKDKQSMTTYKGIRGQTIRTIAGDASPLITGDIWYSSTAKKIRGAKLAAGAWASGGTMNTARNFLAGSGTQTAGFVASGETPGGVPVKDDVETYDGSSWTVGYLQNGDFPTFKIYDASENEYYLAIPSEIFAVSEGNLFVTAVSTSEIVVRSVFVVEVTAASVSDIVVKSVLTGVTAT